MFGMANVMPGQILLPPPNGINAKSAPLKSIPLLRNLSGLKLSASVQHSAFLPIAQALIITLVLEGISYPLISHLSLLSLGTNNGTGGCNLNVSLIMDFKYISFCNSVSSTYPFLSYTFLTSACTFSITLGFLINSDIAHSTVEDEVSPPPTNMS
ncbi:hypothetical protein V8G54_033148 [Vigna mungo]|uniref:Uncharacterized protein n=1 Tax=Vigna mungo TaxID=3915 RepID=A0AAQ3RJH0_VIGMU